MDESKELQDRFYKLLLALTKKYGLRYHMHFTIYGHEEDYIKVWEYHGETQGKCICNIHEKGEGKEAECYRWAVYELTYYQKQREKTEKRMCTDTVNTDLAV